MHYFVSKLLALAIPSTNSEINFLIAVISLFVHLHMSTENTIFNDVLQVLQIQNARLHSSQIVDLGV